MWKSQGHLWLLEFHPVNYADPSLKNTESGASPGAHPGRSGPDALWAVAAVLGPGQHLHVQDS